MKKTIQFLTVLVVLFAGTGLLMAYAHSGNGSTSNELRDDIVIKIDRLSFSDLCIQGNLYVNNEFVGYSLELPEVGNHTDVSCIPKGTYEATVRTDGSRGWRLELDYPTRPNVQIHIGNTRDNSRGCILVGRTADAENCTVGNSGGAMAILKDKFYTGGNSSSKVTVIVN